MWLHIVMMLKVTFCSTQKIWWNLSLAQYRGDEIPLIETGFEICHVCFASPHHLKQILRHYSPAETDCALSVTPFCY